MYSDKDGLIYHEMLMIDRYVLNNTNIKMYIYRQIDI